MIEMEYETKDSGQRQMFSTGMQRDLQTNKPRFDLLIPQGVPFNETVLYRWAQLMARGAVKYEARNWELAETKEELARAKDSAFRHFVQWITGEEDEDHAVAVMFNIQLAEHVKYKLKGENNGNLDKD